LLFAAAAAPRRDADFVARAFNVEKNDRCVEFSVFLDFESIFISVIE
jgi:hypothetical protein